MSKTDKTRPFWVKLTDSARNYRDVHDHRQHECNLPAQPSREWAPQWTQTGSTTTAGCGYTYTSTWISDHGSCGCQMCHGSYDNKQQRRRDRKRARQALRTGRYEA